MMAMPGQILPNERLNGADDNATKLEDLLSQWPIVSTFAQRTAVGDLINLARSSTSLRAVLHDFGSSQELHTSKDYAVAPENPKDRKSLLIGRHSTEYWQTLKQKAMLECSSPQHTKGTTPRPCRYCSKPICEACIVKSSSKAAGRENTFQNRQRHLCRQCWETGQPSKSQRFQLLSENQFSSRYIKESRHGDLCVCTLKADGWICIECKHKQNQDAVGENANVCHGAGCTTELDLIDSEKRSICLWCHKALPTALSGASRRAWNQKLINSRKEHAEQRAADIAEYNRKRSKEARMTKRELRGDATVEGDPDADRAIYLRHLDVINYRGRISLQSEPSGQQIFDSKRGYWRYSVRFLCEFRGLCTRSNSPIVLTTITDCNLPFARTNHDMRKERNAFLHSRSIWRGVALRKLRVDPDNSTEPVEHSSRYSQLRKVISIERYQLWLHNKRQIVELVELQKKGLLDVLVWLVQHCDFGTTNMKELYLVLELWGLNTDLMDEKIITGDGVGVGDMLGRIARNPNQSEEGDTDDHEITEDADDRHISKAKSVSVTCPCDGNYLVIDGSRISSSDQMRLDGLHAFPGHHFHDLEKDSYRRMGDNTPVDDETKPNEGTGTEGAIGQPSISDRASSADARADDSIPPAEHTIDGQSNAADKQKEVREEEENTLPAVSRSPPPGYFQLDFTTLPSATTPANDDARPNDPEDDVSLIGSEEAQEDEEEDLHWSSSDLDT